ncbi:MAG: EAL domain-containing protein [Gammaproteobacteria bacterium]|nr:EAL domain-containing protein [Gammaproteobacteria bacterium]
MAKENKINIFIIDESFNTEDNIVKLMRSAGFAAHTTRIEDEEDLEAALKKTTPDVLLYSMGMELISLEQTIACIKEKASSPVPVIAVNRKGHEAEIVKVMRAGARDLSDYETPTHLELIIIRECEAFKAIKKSFLLEQTTLETEKRCEALLDSSRDAIAYIHEGMHVYSNESYLELFGFSESEELEGMPILDMVGMDDRDSFKTFLRENFKDNTMNTNKLKTSLKKSDSTEFDGEMEFSSARIDGEPCIQVIIRNQVDSAELEKQLTLMSQKDPITGLYNRQYFHQLLDEKVKDGQSGKEKSCVLIIHIDNFSDIKKEAGVAGSDQLLNEISRVFEETSNKDDILAHFESNIFTIIGINQTASSAEEFGQKIIRSTQDYIANINNKSINPTCTIGIAVIDDNAPDSTEIMLRAERALEEAESKGVGQLVVYQPKEGELTQKEIDAQVVEEIKKAVKDNRFKLYFQPIVSLHGDPDERYEVFLRLFNEEGNIVPPEEFFPAAERTGMSMTIDRYVLLNTITTLTKQWKAGKRTIFFVKLTPSSLKDTNLITWLSEQLKKYNVPKNSMVFEVKENMAATSAKYTAEIATKLKQLNCAFALDDFGKGDNPFALLKHIPTDYLKLEKSFMENIIASPENQETVKGITEKAMEMNKLTIAQCVEDAGSLSVLWGMGINFIQGNFLQEPSPDLDYDFTSMSG